jgi:hypothetical protein
MTLDQFQAVTAQIRWSSYAAMLLGDRNLTLEAVDNFGTYWIVGGHHIREQIADDRVLVQLLRHILPLYKGGAIELFRGENRDRWERSAIGLAWTPNIEKARMFGRGLNAVSSGGVLLRAWFEPNAIISEPNSHSKYLGEVQFTIDPFAIGIVYAIEFFSPIA